MIRERMTKNMANLIKNSFITNRVTFFIIFFNDKLKNYNCYFIDSLFKIYSLLKPSVWDVQHITTD